MDSPNKLKWTLYISLASMFVFVSVTEVGPFCSFNHSFFSVFREAPVHKYVIVFDGGSTGTRVHVFTFVNNSSDGHLTLQDAYFEETKPGLSNYADRPHKAANSVLNLLEKAKDRIPPNYWDQTPVALKATAGLRLLPRSNAQSILESVSQVFENSPFASNDKSATVLDGEDEGLYAWFTLNFLLGRLSDANRSVVSLDLGGGSTQITFTPVMFDTFLRSPKEYVVVKKIENKTMPIYTHSYLGLGLMSARLSILRLSSENTASSSSSEAVFRSSCVHVQKKFVWKHDTKEYIIKSRKDESYGFQDCYEKSVQFLGNTVDKPEEIQRREIYALSYYVDRSVDLGIVGPEGGIITVGQFVGACKMSCSDKTPKQNFLCLDCSYISALLMHGLGLDEGKELQLSKKIDGIDSSWGLGAAFSMLS
ncbi:hypothetical protein JTE90_007473 [Oedothorax gibbosus]|uniref:Ectonucleoside triphosphate diphosphohydrolase 5 n=1 Tax=Oedothorax gibbosus TaxID=931172 RepID=A0AAV6U947_9ARAC|nr:hypothetical protein JTE90_007473 [Oedothorax gibbosus]